MKEILCNLNKESITDLFNRCEIEVGDKIKFINCIDNLYVYKVDYEYFTLNDPDELNDYENLSDEQDTIILTYMGDKFFDYIDDMSSVSCIYGKVSELKGSLLFLEI